MLRFPFFLFSFALTFLLCPAAAALAKRVGAVDLPGGRHIHHAPTPRLGGLALACGVGGGLLLSGAFRFDRHLLAVASGGVVILILGIRDDTKGLSPSSKIALQLTAALLAVFFGRRLEGMGVFSVPVTLLWLLLMTNAFNLIDGLDGLCAGCGGGCAGWMAILGGMAGNQAVTAAALALLGGCLGFLPHNLRRKKLFLGDTGAQLIGFFLGVLSIPLLNGGGGVSLLCIAAYPLAETATSILRRVIKGQSPFKADRGHFHHRLTDRGIPPRKATALLLLPSLFSGSIGVLLPIAPNAAGAVLMLCLLFVPVCWWVEGEGLP